MKGNIVNVIEKMNSARQGATPARQGDIDHHQYLLDKAARLAHEAATAQEPAPDEPPKAPAESDAARQARLIAKLNAARSGGPICPL
jgi:hypothetical protein